MFPQRAFSDADIYRRRHLIAMTVTLAAMMELLDTSIVNVAITQIMGNLGATLEEVTWVSTGYIVANVIVLPLSGWFSNRFGRRNYFMGSIALFIVSSFFCGNADSLSALVFWRIMQGLGGGGLISTAQSTIFETFPPRELGTGMAIFGMGIMMGPTLGPTVGGFITYHASWPWIFYINLPIGLTALALANNLLPDSKFHRPVTKVDWTGILLLATSIGTLQIMLERGERQQWFDSAEIQLYAATSLLTFIAFIWHELECEHPVVNLGILRDRQYATGLIFSFLLGMSLFATVFYLPLYLQTLLGYNAWETGKVILPGALANGFTMAMLGKFIERHERLDLRVLVIIGTGIFGLSMWQHGHFTTQSGDTDFFWPLILRGVGLGFLFVPLNALTMASVAPREIPNATGIYTLVRQLGGSVGIAAAATLYVHWTASFKADLSLHLVEGSAGTQGGLFWMENWLHSRGTNAANFHETLLRLVDAKLTAQSSMIAFEQIFMLFSLTLVCALPFLLLMPLARGLRRGGADH
ncbi:MAG TPA: DHA2 family efflux MFS transporter permease subunit [Moraxellaceae bacterium]|nr:DHA2 family efflux MFS transporter permease subunit [Moraxellaceae bacterium]